MPAFEPDNRNREKPGGILQPEPLKTDMTDGLAEPYRQPGGVPMTPGPACVLCERGPLAVSIVLVYDLYGLRLRRPIGVATGVAEAG